MTAFVESCVVTVADSAVAAERLLKNPGERELRSVAARAIAARQSFAVLGERTAAIYREVLGLGCSRSDHARGD